MKNRSIRSRLMVWTSVLAFLVFTISAAAVYLRMKETLFNRLDQELRGSINMLTTEIEVINGEVFHEWLGIVNRPHIYDEKSYVQVWEIETGHTVRSASLEESDLSKIYGEVGEIVFKTITTPDGRRLRAAGSALFPSIAHAPPGTSAPGGQLHVMVIALDMEGVDHALRSLLVTLGIALVVSTILTLLAIYFIVERSLKPIKALEEELSGINVNAPHSFHEGRREFPDELVGLVGKYEDLFQRVSRVRQRERDFSANAAHELRTPLAGIQATLEQSLSVRRSQDDYRDHIKNALGISLQMRRLVDQLMRFSRLKNGTEIVSFEEVNLHALIDARLSDLEERMVDRGQEIVRNFAIPDPIVTSDETLLTILIGNLLGNASSHSPENVTITVNSQPGDNGWTLEISNPLAEKIRPDLERIFDPFYTEDESHRADAGHSGIGLALGREIVGALEITMEVSIRDDAHFVMFLEFPKNDGSTGATDRA